MSQKKKLPQWLPNAEETLCQIKVEQKFCSYLGFIDKQEQTFETILKTNKKTILLHGITGSGRQNLSRLAANQVNKTNTDFGTEISLTPQTFRISGKNLATRLPFSTAN